MNDMMPRAAAVFILCAGLLQAAGAAAGQKKAAGKGEAVDAKARQEAKTLFKEGVAAFAEKSYAEALELFTASYDLNPLPTVLYNIGMCQRALLDFASSIMSLEAYLEAAGDGVPEKESQSVAAMIEEMETVVGKLYVKVSEPGAVLRIDGRQIGLTPFEEAVPVNPGTRKVVAEKEGFARAEATVIVESGRSLALELTLVPEAPPGGKGGAPPEKAPKDKKTKKAILKSPILWTVLGIVVVGGAAATGIAVWQTSGKAMDDADWIIRGD